MQCHIPFDVRGEFLTRALSQYQDTFFSDAIIHLFVEQMFAMNQYKIKCLGTYLKLPWYIDRHLSLAKPRGLDLPGLESLPSSAHKHYHTHYPSTITRSVRMSSQGWMPWRHPQPVTVTTTNHLIQSCLSSLYAVNLRQSAKSDV